MTEGGVLNGCLECVNILALFFLYKINKMIKIDIFDVVG